MKSEQNVVGVFAINCKRFASVRQVLLFLLFCIVSNTHTRKPKQHTYTCEEKCKIKSKTKPTNNKLQKKRLNELMGKRKRFERRKEHYPLQKAFVKKAR